MRRAGVARLVAEGLQPLLVGRVHALGDGGEERRIGRALAFGGLARELDRAAQRRAGGEATRDVDGDAMMLERQRIDEARLVVLEVVVGDRRAAGLQVGRDVAREAAFVIFAWAALGQPAHRLAKIAELDVARRALPI